MSRKSDAKRAAAYVLLVVAIVIGAQVAIDGALGSPPVYVVVSGSMTPTLEIGDLVIVQSVPFSSIHVGDVIVYVQPTPSGGCRGLTIVHRVVAITNGNALITQGDNRVTNPLPDEPYEWPPVPPACVKGRVVLALPYLGRISMLFPPPYNYALVVVILLFVFLTEMSGSKERPEESRSPSAPQRARPDLSRRERDESWSHLTIRAVSHSLRRESRATE